MIQTVAILGAGAVGSYFINGLKEKLGENLWVVADGERKTRLETEGIFINHENVGLNVRTPEEAKGVDLLIVAVKYGALRACLDNIEKIVGEHTMVMSVMNGVDSEEIIAERIGMAHIVYAMIKIASERDGSSVVFNAEATPGVYFGEADGERSVRIAELERLFADTGIHYHVMNHIIQEIWLKYALNIGLNLPQAMIGCGMGGYQDSAYIADIRKCLRAEVAAVAAAKGIDIEDETAELNIMHKAMPKARYSTLQDLDAGRHTEIDMFSGALVRMGQELGVATPFNQMAYNIIKALEEKNDGRFNY